MRIVPCDQGSPEWYAARLGIPTASQFHRIITPKTMRPSASADRYLHELLAERILGQPCDTASTDFMIRGTALEAQAVAAYDLLRADSDPITPVGFVLRDDGRVGCSPDRLVGSDGGLEIKCPSAPVHVAALLGGINDEYRAQVQGQLWVTDRAWWDLFFFNPEMPPALLRVERDEAFVAALEAAVDEFCARLDDAQAALEALGCTAAA